MDQANLASTPIPAPASSPVVRFPIKSPQSTPGGVIGAHMDLVRKIIIDKPHTIKFQADATDLNDYAEHLERLFASVSIYASVIIGEIAYVSNEIDKDYLLGRIEELSEDIVGSLQRGADRLADDNGQFGVGA